MHLEHKIVVLTGASSGLGSAIAKKLVEKGALVYGLSRSIEKLELLKSKLGHLFIPVQMDITKLDQLSDWIESTFVDGLLPDVLINNAGIGSFSKIDETLPEYWLEMMNTNLNGMYYITSQLVPYFKKNKQTTHIVNIGSVLGTTGREESTAYCTTKFGVRGFSDSLFKELRADHIKVTCINPGSIATDFFQTSGIKKHDNMIHPEDLALTIVHVLETPDNMLINELEVRPLLPK